MVSLVKAVIFVGLGLALNVTPALALTYVPASSIPSDRQFADPDAALETMSSSLRDDVIDNNSPTLGAPRTFAGDAIAGEASSAPGEQPSGPPFHFGSRNGFRVAPGLSPAELYDDEPPFMPSVVGQPKP